MPDVIGEPRVGREETYEILANFDPLALIPIRTTSPTPAPQNNLPTFIHPPLPEVRSFARGGGYWQTPKEEKDDGKVWVVGHFLTTRWIGPDGIR
jgi:hypothetical protein